MFVETFEEFRAEFMNVNIFLISALVNLILL